QERERGHGDGDAANAELPLPGERQGEGERQDEAGERWDEHGFQNPRLTARYGSNATSASPGFGSSRLKTASTCALRSVRRYSRSVKSPARICTQPVGRSVSRRT